MQHSVVAARYARAFFELVKGQGSEELHKACSVLMGFKEAVGTSDKFLSFIKDPVLNIDEKKKAIEAILKKLDSSASVCQFFFLLLEKKRLVYIEAIADHFSALIDESEGISRGVLSTAIALDAKRQESIKSALEKQTGRKLALEFSVNPELLGGIVLKVGDTVLDSSLATQLHNFSQTIKRGKVSHAN